MTIAYARRDDAELRAALDAVPDINTLLDAHAAARGTQLAIDMPAQAGGRLRLTYAQLRRHACALARGLRSAGVQAGDHVAILADGQAYAECVLAYLALLRLGAVMVPVNPRYVDSEVVYALTLADCSAILAQPDFAARIDGCRDRLPMLRLRISIGPEPADGWLQLVSMDEESDASLATVAGSALANILFTSGTTGKPKGVMHTHATALATGAIFSRGLTLQCGDVFHHGIPFFTSSGAQFALMAALWSGATLVTEAVFDAAAVLDRMACAGTTVYLGVPSHLLFLLDAIGARPELLLPALRLWNYGGAPMPNEAIRVLQQRFPAVAQRQNYGMTETGPTGAMLDPEHLAAYMGSTGRPMPLCELRVTTAEGSLAAAGVAGEIWVRSVGCMTGYYSDPVATAATMDQGWVRTGDLGRLDEDGFLYYVDRLKDIVNRGGLKISSFEVEDAIHRIPGVLEAAVVSVPHARLGEDLVAFVVGRPGALLARDALRAALAGSLADFKVPRDIRLIDSMPRNAMGKILKARLRELARHAPGTAP